MAWIFQGIRRHLNINNNQPPPNLAGKMIFFLQKYEKKQNKTEFQSNDGKFLKITGWTGQFENLWSRQSKGPACLPIIGGGHGAVFPFATQEHPLIWKTLSYHAHTCMQLRSQTRRSFGKQQHSIFRLSAAKSMKAAVRFHLANWLKALGEWSSPGRFKPAARRLLLPIIVQKLVVSSNY